MSDFNYSRVDLARRRRGCTKGTLAKKAGISPRNLTEYEKGHQEPTLETISRFASALRFPKEFFYGPDLEEPTEAGASFRALSSLKARERGMALGSGALAFALADWIEAHFDLPTPDIPQQPGVDPETAAQAVRTAWGLGERSIANMVHLLEARGVRVFSLSEDARAIDAFSEWRGTVPYVFLNTKKTAEHSRMDAAHELGHLVLHAHGTPRGRDPEAEARAFGSAFLMPAGSVLAKAPRGGRLPQLIRAKGRWNVSAAALAVRMHRLGLLSDWQYRSIFMDLNRGGRTNEPTAPGREPLRQETSQVLEKVLRELRDENMTKASLAQTLHIPLEDINASIFGLVLTGIAGAANPEPQPRQQRPDLRLV